MLNNMSILTNNEVEGEKLRSAEVKGEAGWNGVIFGIAIPIRKERKEGIDGVVPPTKKQTWRHAYRPTSLRLVHEGHR
ncbi:hypothetical protein L1987_61136 [Smallanthus sonchifolius]|uniref:Uncharacterized protein n=1 Tax=Smallanthus sonchifolius TaxID=185202 RepID=A0ACB9DAV6_9ASTR|nr:hypothetical protein L1987_61136 [Smallanthus sonchifolius]